MRSADMTQEEFSLAKSGFQSRQPASRYSGRVLRGNSLSKCQSDNGFSLMRLEHNMISFDSRY